LVALALLQPTVPIKPRRGAVVVARRTIAVVGIWRARWMVRGSLRGKRGTPSSGGAF